jgi:3D (Asp-Asp-Asp) domain-containing protein
MIRTIYSLCFLVLSTAIPVLAKNTVPVPPTTTPSSKAESKGVLAPVAAPKASVAKVQTPVIEKKTLTVDYSRDSLTPMHVDKTPDVASAKTAEKPAEKTDAKRVAASSTPVIRNSTIVTAGSGSLHTFSEPVMTDDRTRLARVTAYWAGEGDYYTGRCMSATGVRLHDGHCAVDPSVIPYGSVVQIAGVGKFLAVDTGSAVISRTAAKESGHTSAERHALVIDIFFEDRSEGERFAAGAAKFVEISWWSPTAMNSDAKAARSFFADENWTKIQSKQL